SSHAVLSGVDGSLFLNFLPAVSPKAARTMRGRIRSRKIHRWTQLTIKELANSFNPVLQGWINYYGKFCKSKLAPIFDPLKGFDGRGPEGEIPPGYSTTYWDAVSWLNP
ncbi:TPA: hypothetical protein G8O64_004969, partial [Salmonella enterica]|nr:hypothetical protein [Salmonella enterica]HAG5359210.1 hypothetical protein [Salmonella enterica]